MIRYGKHVSTGTRLRGHDRRWAGAGLKIAGILLVAIILLVLTAGVDQATQDALRVSQLIQTISNTPPAAAGDTPRSVKVKEREINAYIAQRIKQENEKILKQLEIKLLDDNRIKGSVGFDLTGLNMLNLLPEQLDFRFDGRLEAQDRKARFNVQSLHLDDQLIQPAVLDMVIAAIAGIYGTQPSSVNDWYVLPYDIQRVDVRKGMATIYY